MTITMPKTLIVKMRQMSLWKCHGCVDCGKWFDLHDGHTTTGTKQSTCKKNTRNKGVLSGGEGWIYLRNGGVKNVMSVKINKSNYGIYINWKP